VPTPIKNTRSARLIFCAAWAMICSNSGLLIARFFSNLGKFSHAIDDPYYPVSPDLYENAIAIILSARLPEVPTPIKNTRSARLIFCAAWAMICSNSGFLLASAPQAAWQNMAPVSFPIWVNSATRLTIPIIQKNSASH
jgi:hypothetical protein